MFVHLKNAISRRSFAAQCASAIGLGATTCCAAENESDRPNLRVLTYNIHHGEGTDGKIDYERQAKIISSLEPDVVALQEVDRGTRRTGEVDQAATLARLTGMNHTFGRAMYYDGGEYGEAVLSRHPIDESKSHPLPFRFGQEPRAALAVRVTLPAPLPPLTFVGTHLCHQSSETRTEQAQQLNRLFPARGRPPIILAGDLNARPGSEPMAVLLDTQWHDAIAPSSRIDYVLYRQSDPWRVVAAKVVNDRIASDHRPVLSELAWTA